MPRDGAATRERILAAANELTLHGGFGSTSVDQILLAAPASKGAFFHHFKTKAHLEAALAERARASDLVLLEEFRDAYAGQDSHHRNLQHVLSFLADRVDTWLPGWRLYAVLMSEGEALPPAVRRASSKKLLETGALRLTISSCRSDVPSPMASLLSKR